MLVLRGSDGVARPLASALGRLDATINPNLVTASTPTTATSQPSAAGSGHGPFLITTVEDPGPGLTYVGNVRANDPFAPRPTLTRREISIYRDSWNWRLGMRAAEVQRTLDSLVTDCINGRSVFDSSIQSACQNFLSPERILMPLGVISFLQVPFPVTELTAAGEDGKVERTYTPDPGQAFDASYYAYMASQKLLLDMLVTPDSYKTPINFEAFVAGRAADVGGWPQWREGDDLEQNSMLAIIKLTNWSVNQAINATGHPTIATYGNPWIPGSSEFHPGDFVLSAPGSVLNSIAPTNDELTKPGGLYAFYKRGGFLYAKSAIDGTLPLLQWKLKVNVGYFKCADGKLAVYTQDVPDEGHGWLAYVKFGSSYTLHAQMKDRSTWESVKNGVKTFVEKSAQLICAAAPFANGIGQSILATKTCTSTVTFSAATKAQKEAAGCTPLEIVATAGTTPANSCQTKLQSSCKEGDPGCTCKPAQTATGEQMAVAAGASILTNVCNLPKDGPTPPITCDQMLGPPSKGWIWWAAAGLGILGGAIYASRK